MSGLASFSNWRQRNQPCFSASSRALAIMPLPFSAAGVSIDPRAEKAHELAALDAEALGHRHDERVALGGADHREADAGVAARRLDDGLAGPERAVALGGLDHAEGEAVLDRAERVERLELDVELDALGLQLC